MSYQSVRGIDRDSKAVAVYAESPDIPQDLALSLDVLSQIIAEFPYPPNSTHYCYHTNGSCHILTAIYGVPQGQKIIHHLALTHDEVSALKENSARPTPAGIIYALLSRNFWKTQADSTIIIPREAPHMPASALPDASTQQTWKTLTGHKSNATLLLAPPYNTHCYIQPFNTITNEQFLLLLHESMWLTSDRGWSKGFRSFSINPEIDFKENDITLLPGSSDRSPTVPTLALRRKLAPISNTVPLPETATLHPEPIPAPTSTITQQSTPTPYKYTEAPDDDCFDMPRKTSKISFFIFGVIVVFILSVIVAMTTYH